MMKKFWIVMIALIVMGNTVNFTPVIAATTSTTPTSTTASTWLETTMDHNEPFIQEIERQTQKSRANIDQTDLDKLTVLQVSGASEIPDKIDLLSNLTKLEAITGTISTLPNSVGNLKELKILNVAYNNISTFPTIVYQLPKLEELQLSGGTMEEIPTSIVNMASHLKFLSMQNNRLVKVPDIIFTTPWINSNGQLLDLMVSGNQIVTNIPANYVSQFNNGDNMLEFYDNQFQKQDQLTTTAGYTLDVPVGTDFSQLTIDKTSLELKSGRTLLPQHEFEFYDDGSSPLIKNGVATATGTASIYVKSKFSTQTNKFARTLVTVNIIAKNGGDVTVKYEDTNGKELAKPIVLNGKAGSTYTSSEKIFPGYTLVATPTNQNGTFTLNPATVNYVYKANDYKLTSTFKDANGQELLPPVVDTNIYKINDTYQTPEANIPGYALVSVPTNQKGTFGAGDITVEYVYKLIDYKLTSTYKDKNGKELLPPVVDTKAYKINDTYQTTEASIPGYTLVSVPTNQTGTFGSGDVTVEYVYKANDYKLTSTYKDENGKVLIPSVVDTKAYKINDTYQTTEASIPGYTLVSAPTNQTGTFGSENITVEYVYKKIKLKENKIVSEKPDNSKNINKEIGSSQKSMPTTGESKSTATLIKYVGTVLVLMSAAWFLMNKKYSK